MDSKHVNRFLESKATGNILEFINSFVAGGYRSLRLDDLHRENILYLYSILQNHWFDRVSDPSDNVVQTQARLDEIERDLQRFSKCFAFRYHGRTWQNSLIIGSATAVQNYEYFKRSAGPVGELLKRSIDPEEARQNTTDLAWILKDSSQVPGEQDAITKQHETIMEWRQSIAISQHRTGPIQFLPSAEIRLFAFRIVVAVFGGLSIVVPMLIMSVQPSQVKSLVTTSAFVIGFGVGMATFVPQAEYKDLLTSTAAYAAVLVVFLGVGGGS